MPCNCLLICEMKRTGLLCLFLEGKPMLASLEEGFADLGSAILAKCV
jgi:hypothetical protein